MKTKPIRRLFAWLVGISMVLTCGLMGYMIITDNMEKFSLVMYPCGFLLISSLGWAVFSTLAGKKILAEDAAVEKEKERIKQNELRIRQENITVAPKIYQRCAELNISDLSNPEQLSGLIVVAKSFNINTSERARELYFIGKARCEAEEKEKAQQAFNECRTKEYEQYKKQKEDTALIERDKYTKLAREHKAKDIAMKKGFENRLSYASKMKLTSAKTRDWAFWGGVANGVGGGALGMATANDIQNSNAKEEEKAERIREEGRKLWDLVWEEQRNYKDCYTPYEQKKEEYINSRLLDNSDPEGKLSLLSIYCNIDITEGKNFLARGAVRSNSRYFNLLEKPCVLDGTLMINIKKPNGEILGTGYLSGPGIGDMDLSRVGFQDVVNFKSLCWVDNYNEIDPNVEYTYEFVPKNLWFIEM